MDNLISAIKKLNSPVVVGLDTALCYIPEYIKKEAVLKYKNTPKAASFAILNFNLKIIDAIKDLVPAVKFQMAYYEAFGCDGIYALQQSCKYAKDSGIYVIIDGKRNDIGSSMEYYCKAYLGETELFCKEKYRAFHCDCLTINGYLGSDSINVALKSCLKYDKEIFILIKTSNPSSFEIQDEKNKDDIYIYEKVGEMCEKLGTNSIGKYGFSKIGAVVGATHKKQLKYLRERFPNIFFLVPGFGAQGATAKDVSYAFNKDGVGAIVNNSRNILTAWQKENSVSEKNFDAVARKQVKLMIENINENI